MKWQPQRDGGEGAGGGLGGRWEEARLLESGSSAPQLESGSQCGACRSPQGFSDNLGGTPNRLVGIPNLAGLYQVLVKCEKRETNVLFCTGSGGWDSRSSALHKLVLEGEGRAGAPDPEAQLRNARIQKEGSRAGQWKERE